MGTVSEITRGRVEVAEAVRELVHRLAAAEVDDGGLARVRALVSEASLLLATAPRRRRSVPDFAELAQRRDEEPGLHAMADRAVAGPANPFSVHLEPRFEDGVAIADVTFGPAFEGALGRVHGGIVAAVLDDLLGAAMAQARAPGFTGRLTVHYRAPVPVEREVRFRTWPGEREGRKLRVHGEVRLDDRVLVTADALFVLVDTTHFATPAAELLDRPEDGARPDAPGEVGP